MDAVPGTRFELGLLWLSRVGSAGGAIVRPIPVEISHLDGRPPKELARAARPSKAW